jgi:glycolate oxidase
MDELLHPGFPFRHPRLTEDPEVRASYAADASGLSRVPDAVARPETEEEVADLVRRCAAAGVALTPQGLRSSTTGSSVAAEGLALSLERMERVLEIDPQRRVAIAEPGIVLGELKQAVDRAGLFYPPDPTSEGECALGGTVATNASGSRTYRYGPTRAYVRALRVVLADGSATEIRRVQANKNAAGYFGFQDPIDLWIGSEGTLGVITRIELDLLDRPPGFYGVFAFFPGWEEAIDFVLRSDLERRTGRVLPRCLELFDGSALAIAEPEASGLKVPAGAGAAVFFEEEGRPEDAADSAERWLSLIEGSRGLADATLLAQTDAEKAELRRMRHAIPAGMNERGARAVRSGGRKVSTDFAVSLESLPVLMRDSYAIARETFGGLVVAYGHVGNGHPHFNLLAEDAEQLARAEEAAHRMARRALELGGTLSAEHGIGKLKRVLFRELTPGWAYEGMRALKAVLDPKGIFSPGNLFD